MTGAFAWRDLLEWAEEQARGAGTEATRRAVVSRAYYACYHECLARARQQKFSLGQFPSMGSHEALAAWCNMRPEASWRTAGKVLRTLKNRRVHADYQIRPLTTDDMIEQLELASIFIRSQMDALR